MSQHITCAQADFVRDFLVQKLRCKVTVDGPIASTRCIRIRYREQCADSRDGGGEPPQVRSVIYVDSTGKRVRWNTLTDRPTQTPTGRRLKAA